MKTYQIIHKTTYSYKGRASLCQNEARIHPATTPFQKVTSFELTISPEPVTRTERVDFFGNRVIYFAIEEPHNKLVTTAKSTIELDDELIAERPSRDESTPWETVVTTLRSPVEPDDIHASQYIFPSLRIDPELLEIREYAKPSFPEGRPIAEGAFDLMRRIFTDFDFVSGHTTTTTPISEVMIDRKGVCQDFAQIGIACLRSLGLPARYVSGYIETFPPEGQEKLVGADASHAWFSTYCPKQGWLDFDPTNNQQRNDCYVIIGTGRDYSDIPPLSGIMTGGAEHKVKPSVDMRTISSTS